MDKVNKDKRGIKFVFLIIFLASISIFISTGQKMMFGYEIHVARQSILLNKNNKIYADTFFETNVFDNQILQNLIDKMIVATSNSNDYEKESIEDARNMLNEFKDIKFFVKIIQQVRFTQILIIKLMKILEKTKMIIVI
ncbi:hypothetical protein H477_3444 [[Clostridium] sordellii ATCC 9714]|nr:hypothetical protein H477_3444 [[Clostridium] sordellii ATCC 9714] [Paeniclostridium sordellii ATCC 9714]